MVVVIRNYAVYLCGNDIISLFQKKMFLNLDDKQLNIFLRFLLVNFSLTERF